MELLLHGFVVLHLADIAIQCSAFENMFLYILEY